MFDIGFSELLLCFVVALVVLGPERLPRVARTVGRWTGQAKGYLRNLSAELDRESQLSELKQQLGEAQRALREGSEHLKSEFARETETVRKHLSESQPQDSAGGAATNAPNESVANDKPSQTP